MHVTLVQVHVFPEHVDDFVAAVRENHEGSVEESGNVRFDVLQLEDDPTHFLLYEVYRSAEDAAAHKKTPHYLAWKDTVAPWMAMPRQGIRYRAIAPGDPETW